tara:strand:+ start:2920 stop:3288 length:369 start_codon:yes stop_codon:yes gene_type:complete
MTQEINITKIAVKEIDHSLCLNCQIEKGSPHLCSSCQWYGSGMIDDSKLQWKVDQKLNELQSIIQEELELDLYVDENSVKFLLQRVQAINDFHEEYLEYRDDIVEVLQQIISFRMNHSNFRN